MGLGLLAPVLLGVAAYGQWLDPARDESALRKAEQRQLAESFIWTKDDAAALDPVYQAKVRGQDDKIAPHYFRVKFSVAAVPKEATLYLAGPRTAHVFLNGTRVMEVVGDGSAKGFKVLHADVAGALRVGGNVLAMELVRGHSSLHTGASPTINQVTYGEVIGVKIVPAGAAVDTRALVVSDETWRSSLTAGEGWKAAGFDDAGWAPVQVLGAMGGKKDFLQWNADAGLYAWPGYAGIGSALRTFRLPVAEVMGKGVQRSVGGFEASSAAVVTVDFGKEVSGRVHLVSATDRTVEVETSYGESAEEADGHAYLGARVVTVPARGEAFGPKSAFRYVRLRFPEGASAWTAIDVEGIAYPVEYLGSFASSDAKLNRIWETGAYTARLCMQDGIWDAPKRDRGRWMGDLDVTGRVIESVFGERPLMEETMSAVIGDEPVTRDVNTIAGYSALWIAGQAEFYRHEGDLAYLRSVKRQMVELLGVMDRQLDADGMFVNPEKHKVFVDWSDGFSADGPEARAATHMEFYLAYREAAFLLGELGDAARAAEYADKARRMKAAAQSRLANASGTFGERWQTNAMAVASGVATRDEEGAIWGKVLSHVEATMAGAMAPKTIVTPYYGYYVLRAMARTGHRAAALDWMRQYWGGMLDEGATSFWEAYDPRWPKKDFHASLEADGKKGYYVSLAHGWASGPTAWLMEEILGIEPVGAGFARVRIRPDLAGLAWAKGAEPTPRGLIRVSAAKDAVVVEVPDSTEAEVSLPFVGQVLENGRLVMTAADESGRSLVTLRRGGVYRFTVKTEGTR